MELSRAEVIASRESVVVLLPAQQPRLMAGWNLKSLSPIHIARNMGADVEVMPITNSINLEGYGSDQCAYYTMARLTKTISVCVEYAAHT